MRYTRWTSERGIEEHEKVQSEKHSVVVRQDALPTR